METMNSLAEIFSSEKGWIIEVFIIVLASLIAHYIAVRLFDRLQEQLKRTQNLWDDALVSAARKPVTIAIWFLGISWAAEIARGLAESVILDAIHPMRSIVVIALLAWFLVRFIAQVEANILLPDSETDEESRLDESTVHALGKLVRLAVIITAALVVLQNLGYSISGVLAFGGIGGIAVGFAAKDLLANFFGGLMIYLDRPFKIGDWIRSPDKQIEGTVEYIGWRLTRIRTFDKRPLYVPNSTFMQIAVENPSRMSHRRIYETIGIRYDDANKASLVIDEIKKMLQQHDEIDTTQTLMVNLNAFADSSLDFFIYCFTKTTDWQHYHHVKQNVLQQVLDIIDRHDAQVAFPTSVVELTSLPSAEAG